MPKLESHIGKTVTVRASPSVRDGKKRVGKIVDEVWPDDSQLDPRRHGHDEPNCWGYYAFCSQLIEWEDDGYSIRLAYYRRPCKGARWQFASQTTINTSPRTVRQLLERTLARIDWFTKPGRDEQMPLSQQRRGLAERLRAKA